MIDESFVAHARSKAESEERVKDDFYEDVATFNATDRVRFVVRRVKRMAHEYHIEKQVRDAFGGTQWFGAIYQCEQSEETARLVAQSCAASYGELHPRERRGSDA